MKHKRLLKSEVKKLTEQKLHTSNISKIDMKDFDFSPVIAKTVKGYGDHFENRGGIFIPYYDLKGKVTDFFRVRYLEDPLEDERFTDKPPKYMQPKGVAPQFYLPPIIDWEEVAKEPEIDVYITEGEFKAACGAINSMATIGLGGVYSWKSKKLKLPSIVDFEDFEWKGRDVYLVFDADLKSNHMVQMALNDLAKTLMRFGAIPKLSFVEEIPEAPKTGMDDYIFHRGVEDFEREVIKKSKTYSMSGELVALNSEVAYLKNPGAVIRFEDSYVMFAKDFTGHQYANRHFFEERFNAKGEPMAPLKKSAARGWLEWEGRNELEGVTYVPGEERIYENKFNMWRDGHVKPEKGNIKPWLEFMDYIFRNEKDARSWFERWCAIQFQKPGVKLYSACLFWGSKQGTGKSLVGITLGEIFGGNYSLLNPEMLKDGHNEWQVNKQFILGDEVTGSDKRKDADLIKRLITQPQVRINEKYKPTYEIPDTINYMFTSNHPDAFFLEDSDRRMFVQKMPRSAMPTEWYQKYDKWLFKENGAAHLYHYFLNLDIGDFHEKERAMVTNAKRDMIITGKSELGRWVSDMLDSPDEYLWMGGIPLESDLLTQQQILNCYNTDTMNNVKAQGMGKMLRTAIDPVNGGKPVRTNAGVVTLFPVRNQDKWENATSEQIKIYYNKAVEKFNFKKVN